MPCDSSYLDADQLEINLSQVLMLLDELKTGIPVDSKSSSWKGYDSRAYCHANRNELDLKVAELCEKLKTVDLKKHSLEMQLWHRDHQIADWEKELNR